IPRALVILSARIINAYIVSYSPFRILLVVVLIVVNGFFAGAEVALLSVRQSRLRQMAEEGQAGAQAALNLLANPGRLLSMTQVGVTLASLGLGWAGEDTLYQILLGVFHPVTTPLEMKFLHGACFALSFLVISYFHVVLGDRKSTRLNSSHLGISYA